MKVLLVYPFFLNESALEQQWMTLYAPLGLLYLAATARDAGHDVAVFDATFASDDSDFVAVLDAHQPEVVCFASLITLRATTLRLARIANTRGAITIVGGPDATASPDAYLLAVSAPRIDIVIRGEADETLIELLRTIELKQTTAHIAGLVTRDGAGGLMHSAERATLVDLARMPLPARDLIDLPRYLSEWKSVHGYSSLTVAASRGCPFGCEHCLNSGVGPHWRVRTVEDVVSELTELERIYAPDRFRLVDEFEGLGRDWLVKLGQAMLAAAVQTPFEGLKPSGMSNVPMLSEVKALCAERSMWLPAASGDAHAAPALGRDDLMARWRDAKLPEGVQLNDP